MTDPSDDLTLQLGITSPSPEQPLQVDWENIASYQVFIKRDDLLHPIISGNKWRKLKYALLDLKDRSVPEVVSFGGGYSNHLHALAYACQALSIKLIAVVRGDYSQQLTPMLNDIQDWEAEIRFVNRIEYKQRDDATYLATLQAQHPKATIIPEGGSQHLALKGLDDLVSELERDYDYVLAPVGSGGTLAGLIQACGKHTVLGIAVLKGQDYLEDMVNRLMPDDSAKSSWSINHEFHFGGYAKRNAELSGFCVEFQQQTRISIEPVYSGKLFFAARQLIAEKAFPPGSRILLIHTGGLQGSR